MSHYESTPTEIVTLPAADSEQRMRRAVPAWAVSIAAHVVVMALLAGIVWVTHVEKDEPPISIHLLPEDVTEVVKPPVDLVKPPAVEIPVIDDSDIESPIADMDAEIETPLDRPDPQPIDDTPKGDTDAIADSAMGGPSFLMSIGSGPNNAAGVMGDRTPGGQIRAIHDYSIHGHKPGQLTRGALRWFKRHQSPNGQWDVDGYQANCSDGLRCEPGTEHTGNDGDLASTSYALMCFLGAGYDQRSPSMYRTTVRMGIEWLLSMQQPDGSFGTRNYEHAIVTTALAEACAMAEDAVIRAAAQRAVDVLLARQIRDKSGYPLGWDYLTSATRNDASVSGWCAMALKSATAAHLNVGEGMQGAKRYLEGAWKAANPKAMAGNLDPYQDTTCFPYTWNQQSGEFDVKPGANSHDLTPVGAVLAVFLGSQQGDPMLETFGNHIEQYQTPKAYPLNTYYLYYDTIAMFQMGGERWKRWDTAFVPVLENAQRQDGCFAGSWDFAGTQFHGHQTGRLLSTAYCCLSLEVYYRYLNLDARGHKAKAL